MNSRIVLDASVLVAAVNSRDSHHERAYSFIQDRADTTWIVPVTTYFEFQAAQSRLRREGKKAIREVYLPNHELREITTDMMRLASDKGLFESLAALRGMDLVVACVAALDGVPIATFDRDFEAVGAVLSVMWV